MEKIDFDKDDFNSFVDIIINRLNVCYEYIFDFDIAGVGLNKNYSRYICDALNYIKNHSNNDFTNMHSKYYNYIKDKIDDKLTIDRYKHLTFDFLIPNLYDSHHSNKDINKLRYKFRIDFLNSLKIK
jgi:hypothetical protein